MYNPSENIVRNRSDISQFLIHLTKNGHYSQFLLTKAGNGYRFRDVIVRAKQSLNEILDTKSLEARTPYGYFKNKIKFSNNPKGPVEPKWIESVCFSEVPLSELASFYKITLEKRNKYQKFGLAFWQDELLKKGVNPVFYFDSQKKYFQDSLDQMLQTDNLNTFKQMLYLYEPFNTPKENYIVNFRWEREWRKLGLLNFDLAVDVAFGICPSDEVNSYQKIVDNQFPFIDPDWDLDQIKLHLRNNNFTKLLSKI